jgi:hypothetical protein
MCTSGRLATKAFFKKAQFRSRPRTVYAPKEDPISGVLFFTSRFERYFCLSTHCSLMMSRLYILFLTFAFAISFYFVSCRKDSAELNPRCGLWCICLFEA